MSLIIQKLSSRLLVYLPIFSGDNREHGDFAIVGLIIIKKSFLQGEMKTLILPLGCCFTTTNSPLISSHTAAVHCCLITRKDLYE